MVATAPLNITWERLPDDYVLEDEPVDNINQPALAAALTESLSLAGRLPDTALTPTNYGICATLDGQMVIKAPDWAFIPSTKVPRIEIERSYTPKLQGDLPAIVMEFLSETEGGEYSTKPTYPPGKWFFYEQILTVPYYVIFSLDTGALEVYHLDSTNRYQIHTANAQGRHWIETMDLFLGTWQGSLNNRAGRWLRWWDSQGEMLLWGTEKVAAERQRAERLAAQLRAAGIEPEL